MAEISRDTKWPAAAAVLAVSAGIMFLALPGTYSVWVYWLASSVALLGALVLIVNAESAWDRMLVNARDAGVVAPH